MQPACSPHVSYSHIPASFNEGTGEESSAVRGTGGDSAVEGSVDKVKGEESSAVEGTGGGSAAPEQPICAVHELGVGSLFVS